MWYDGSGGPAPSIEGRAGASVNRGKSGNRLQHHATASRSYSVLYRNVQLGVKHHSGELQRVVMAKALQVVGEALR